MSLSDSVQVLPGVGPKRVDALAELGIHTIEDLLTYFPYRYDDLKSKQLNEIQDDEKVTLRGTVATEPVVSFFGRHRSRLAFRLLIENDVVPVTFFNQPWLQKQIAAGEELAVYGRFDGAKKTLSGMKVIQAAEAWTPFIRLLNRFDSQPFEIWSRLLGLSIMMTSKRCYLLQFEQGTSY